MIMKALNMIKQAVVSLTSSDFTETYPTVQVSYMGTTKDAYRASIYGLVSRPPKGSLSILFNPLGQESITYSFSDAPDKRIGRGIAEGEVVVGNYSSRAFNYYDNNGQNSMIGTTVYVGSEAVDLISEVIDALTELTTATYPSAVGPAGPMAPPASVNINLIITKLNTIKGSAPLVT